MINNNPRRSGTAEWQAAGIIVVPTIGKCWDCGKDTRFVDIDFVSFLHPGKCQENKIKEWEEADAKAGPYTS